MCPKGIWLRLRLFIRPFVPQVLNLAPTCGVCRYCDRQLYLDITLRYDSPLRRPCRCPTCFEGEQVTPAMEMTMRPTRPSCRSVLAVGSLIQPWSPLTSKRECTARPNQKNDEEYRTNLFLIKGDSQPVAFIREMRCRSAHCAANLRSVSVEVDCDIL